MDTGEKKGFGSYGNLSDALGAAAAHVTDNLDRKQDTVSYGGNIRKYQG